LYVFTHGLICLVEDKTRLLGLVVDMGGDHSYRVGDWLVETPIEQHSEMRLTGVERGEAGLDASKVTVVQRPIDPSRRPFAEIDFPKPSALRSLRRTKIPADLVSGSGLPHLQAAAKDSETFTIAAVHILEYDFKELSDVFLEGADWGPPTVFREGRVATLHFFAEPEVFKRSTHTISDHNISEFHEAARLFSDFEIEIKNAVLLSRLETTEYPADLSSNEALSLLERRLLLNAFAAGYKAGTPGDLPAPSEGGSGGLLCAPLAGRTYGH